MKYIVLILQMRKAFQENLKQNIKNIDKRIEIVKLLNDLLSKK